MSDVSGWTYISDEARPLENEKTWIAIEERDEPCPGLYAGDRRWNCELGGEVLVSTSMIAWHPWQDAMPNMPERRGNDV